jgi:hypothetical protein
LQPSRWHWDERAVSYITGGLHNHSSTGSNDKCVTVKYNFYMFADIFHEINPRLIGLSVNNFTVSTGINSDVKQGIFAVCQF